MSPSVLLLSLSSAKRVPPGFVSRLLQSVWRCRTRCRPCGLSCYLSELTPGLRTSHTHRRHPTDQCSLFNPDQANLGGRLGFIFGGLSFLCLVYLWFYQPETAGRTYEELDEMFMKGVPARNFKAYQTDAQATGEAVKEKEGM
jgi:hypothetical protein